MKPQEKTIEDDTDDQQDWLRKEIPTTWEDKRSLIPKLLFTCLVNFVEAEGGLSQQDVDWTNDLKAGYVSQEYVDSVKKIYSDLQAAYYYVKIERPQREIDFDNSYPETLPGVHGVFEEPTIDELGNKSRCMRSCETLYGMSYEEAYAEHNRLEKLIEDRDQWAMKIIVENVHSLWT